MRRDPDQPTLSDGRVTLRPPDEGDLDAIDAGIRDPEVVRWFGHPAVSAREVLDLNRRRWADGSPSFAIFEGSGACVGHAWVNASAADPAIGYVGYWLLPKARGRGLATRAVRLLSTRAVRLLSRWAVEARGMTTVRLLTEPDNERSQRVAERSGFRRIAILPGHDVIDGRAIDHVLFELSPKDLCRQE